MEYPKKSYLLSLKNVYNKIGEDLSKYDRLKGYEISKDETHTSIKINQKDTSFNGDIILVPNTYLVQDIITTYHIKYLINSIKVFNTRYISDKKIHLLYSIFKYYNILNYVIENNGILDDKLIENIAKTEKGKWYLACLNRGGYMLYPYYYDPYMDIHDKLKNSNKDRLESISFLECLKRYGLEKMDDASERQYIYITEEFERDRKLNEILNILV